MNRSPDLEDQLSRSGERVLAVASEVAVAHPLDSQRARRGRGLHPLLLSVAVVAVVAVGIAALATYRFRGETRDNADRAVSITAPVQNDLLPATTSFAGTTSPADASATTVPSTTPLPSSQSAITFVSLHDDAVAFYDTDGSILRTVVLPAVTPGFERVLVHANEEAAYVADGGRLMVVPQAIASEPTIYDGYSSIGPVSDGGFWRSEAGAVPGFVSWRFESYAGSKGPPIELEISQHPFGEFSDGLAVWDRERSQVLYSSSQSQTVLSRHLPLTTSGDRVLVLDDGTVTSVDEFGETRPLFDLLGAVPASTLEATAVSPDGRRIAMLRKDPDSYKVLDLTVFDLDSTTESVVAIDAGARVQWISESAILVHADRPTAVVVPVNGSAPIETPVAGSYVIAVEVN